MLSYMVPSVEEKPPPVPNKVGHLQLDLDNRETSQTVVGVTITTTLASSAPLTSTHNNNIINTPTTPAENLTNGHPKRIIKTTSKSSTISGESSASSLSSVLGGEVAGTHNCQQQQQQQQDKSKHKVITNGPAKHPTLKRVSFGSSKGSMVETLIYESPLQEEPELSPSTDQASVDSNQGSDSSKASKVRVTFFECEKPQIVSSPEPGDLLDELDAPVAMSGGQPTENTSPHPYNRQASTDSGWDNPFRPDGDLSREADEIVELIKGGKPITPTTVNGEAPKLPNDIPAENGKVPSPKSSGGTAGGGNQELPLTKQSAPNATTTSPPKGVNGTKPVSNGDKAPGQVELQRATVVPASDASQVEHVNLKKKPKCKCCVIQ